MEYSSNIFIEKDLTAVADKHNIYLYDTKLNKLIQNYKLTEEEITTCVLNSDKQNEDKIILLVTDKFGYLHLYDISKNKKISQTKIHDYEIIQSYTSSKKNIIYTLDINGILKMTNFSKGSLVIIEKTINLNKNPSKINSLTKSQLNNKISYFAVDKKEKYLVFNKGLKIKIMNIEKNVTKTVGTQSSQISQLAFSSDSKFVVSSTEKDYFVYLWDWKENLKTNQISYPTVSLQVDSLINKTIIRKVHNTDGVYHAFSFNSEYLYGHYINLVELKLKSSSKASAPLTENFKLHASEKNLIDAEFFSLDEDLVVERNAPISIFVIYGNTFVPTRNILMKKIKYANNFNTFINEKITVSLNDVVNYSKKSENGKVTLNKNFSVLNEIEMNENNNQDGLMIQTDITETEITNQNTNSISTLDEKISLINVIKNSIINNDITTLEWTLEQKDYGVIETTVRKMNTSIIKLFVSKLIDLFQSNRLIKSKSNFLIWIELLFKFHSAEILRMPVEVINILKRVNSIVTVRTKNLERLYEINNKFDKILKEINYDPAKKTSSVCDIVYEPLLVYNESDSEEEKKKKNRIEEESKKKGLNLTKEKEFVKRKKEFMEDEGDVNMFVDDNAFENDAMMEDLDIEEENDLKEKEDNFQSDESDSEDDD